MPNLSRALLSTNIYDEIAQDKLLVIGSCLLNRYPQIIAEVAKKYDGHVLHVCLEETHYNKIVAKLFNILALGKLQEVGLLTVDGSPHCVQLHYARKYLQRGLKHQANFTHYVITSQGILNEIPQEIVDSSKEFSTKRK